MNQLGKVMNTKTKIWAAALAGALAARADVTMTEGTIDLKSYAISAPEKSASRNRPRERNTKSEEKRPAAAR